MSNRFFQDLARRRATLGRSHRIARDSYRLWSGVRKVRDAVIGETHAEARRRALRYALRRLSERRS